MTLNQSRALALGGLAAGAALMVVAVLSAVGPTGNDVSSVKAAAATIDFRTIPIGRGRIQVNALPTGTCFTVRDPSGSAHACPPRTAATEIGYAATAQGIGGIAGSDVAAVIVRLTRRGTVWATLHAGAFYAAVPAGHKVRAVVKVLRDGTRTAFAA